MEKPEIFINLLVKLRKDALLPDYPLQRRSLGKIVLSPFAIKWSTNERFCQNSQESRAQTHFGGLFQKMEIAQRETHLVGVKVAWKFIWAQVIRLHICPFIWMSAWKTTKIGKSFWKYQLETSQTANLCFKLTWANSEEGELFEDWRCWGLSFGFYLWLTILKRSLRMLKNAISSLA